MQEVRLSRIMSFLSPKGISLSDLCVFLKSRQYSVREDSMSVISETMIHSIEVAYGVTIPHDSYKNDWLGYPLIVPKIGDDAFARFPWLYSLRDCETYSQCAQVINNVYNGVFEMNEKGIITQRLLAPFQDQFVLAALFSDKSHIFLFKVSKDAFSPELLEVWPRYKYQYRIKWDEKTEILEAKSKYVLINSVYDKKTRRLIHFMGGITISQLLDLGSQNLLNEYDYSPEIFASGTFDETGNLMGLISANDN